MHNIIIYLFVWILYSRVLGVLWHTTRTLVRARSTLTITYTYLPYFVFTTNSVDGQRGDSTTSRLSNLKIAYHCTFSNHMGPNESERDLIPKGGEDTSSMSSGREGCGPLAPGYGSVAAVASGIDMDGDDNGSGSRNSGRPPARSNPEKVAFLLTTVVHDGSSTRPNVDEDGTESMSDLMSASSQSKRYDTQLRRLAIELSLWTNIIILISKVSAYATTLSLSVLAALTDSTLDVVSQLVLNYTERHSSLSRSSALYPAGASRLEPLGVLICAALMGMASFEILKESCSALLFDKGIIWKAREDLNAFFGMLIIVFIKVCLWALCNRAARTRIVNKSGKQTVKVADPTVEALAQDHWNDCLSNAVAAAALLFALKSQRLWFLDPLGAIVISLYIIYSWYETGKEQIEQLTGKSAPDEFIDEIMELASNFDKKMIVDVCRAYHFGPKFLVELEVVLPRHTLLLESHDLGMDLQYEVEAMEEVERCFVHIDYETRPYDEHVVSKVPELRERILRQQSGSCVHSV